jgi:O-acetylhomoserine (thiol)-lyase
VRLLSFEPSNREDAFRFINKMKPIKRATNFNDNKSFMINLASVIYAAREEIEKLDMGVTDNFIRLSVGIESIRDILNDFEQAFDG